MFQDTDWEGCFQKGTRVCAACQPSYSSVSVSRKCSDRTHTIFEITHVCKNHGGAGNHYYHCVGIEQPTLGSVVDIYHSKIVLTDKASNK
jgi:hypothetical protein